MMDAMQVFILLVPSLRPEIPWDVVHDFPGSTGANPCQGALVVGLTGGTRSPPQHVMTAC